MSVAQPSNQALVLVSVHDTVGKPGDQPQGTSCSCPLWSREGEVDTSLGVLPSSLLTASSTAVGVGGRTCIVISMHRPCWVTCPVGVGGKNMYSYQYANALSDE